MISLTYYKSLNLPPEASDRQVIRSIRQDLAYAFIHHKAFKPMRHAFYKAVLRTHYAITETQSSPN